MSAVCQERGPKPGDVIGALCACGHVNVVHDAGGCAVCALRVIAPASDPQPPTLRGQVAKEVGDIVRLAVPLVSHDAPEWDAEQADAVLAVVADWLAAQPLNGSCDGIQLTCGRQRDHDVRLLRGAS